MSDWLAIGPNSNLQSRKIRTFSDVRADDEVTGAAIASKKMFMSDFFTTQRARPTQMAMAAEIHGGTHCAGKEGSDEVPYCSDSGCLRRMVIGRG